TRLTVHIHRKVRYAVIANAIISVIYYLDEVNNMALNWQNSVYSDGSKHFLSNPNPALDETITVKLRVFKNSPVKAVLLRYVINGADHYTPMEITSTGPV